MSPKNERGPRPDSRSIATLNVSDMALVGVGSRLRAMYDDLLNEPVPERLLEVLQRFDRVNDNFPPRRGDLRNGT